MGAAGSGPSTQNLYNEYINHLPTFPEGVRTGAEVAQFFEQKHQFSEVSLFTEPKFKSKIDQVAGNCQEKQRLWSLANQVNLKIQRGFEATLA